MLARADWLDPVDLHQAPDPALANVEPNLLEFHCHPRTTIAAKAEAILFPDMRQHFHIRARTLADRSRAPGSIANPAALLRKLTHLRPKVGIVFLL
ncbi:hypothetical protein YGS_C4P0005 (plasmid) [Sphingobium sp. YG1]|nr:hypothetical protein YGS_C4P0005 [Sphingobium sp. YG1]